MNQNDQPGTLQQMCGSDFCRVLQISNIVASFLTKKLGIHWREGARWFRDMLVDSDLASNTLAWQWVAGCGTDAAPY